MIKQRLFGLGFVVGIGLLFSVCIQARETSGRCFRYNSPLLKHAVEYCIYRTRPDLPPIKGEPVAYFLHGIGGDEMGFEIEKYDVTLEELRQEDNLPPITIVTFSTDGLSYFIDRGKIPYGKDAYETWFINEFIPWVEKEYHLCSQRSCRGIAGNSMGGMGSLNFALRYPDLFSVVAVNSPALFPYNAFDSLAKWAGYFQRHPINFIQGFYLVWDGRRAFRDRRNFDAHSPIRLVPKFDFLNHEMPEMYFDVGGKDYWGFDEGHFLLVDQLKRVGARFESDYYPTGTHHIPDQPDRRAKVLRFVFDRLGPAAE